MHPHRRRKKRPTYGVRTIEVNRGKNGFGFTISGQAPCILSCIINGSPAEKAGLRPGDYLIAVNSQNVSKALHDDVVELIGTSSALKLQIAENYYSDSSEDEHTSFKLRSKCSNKPKHRQQYSSTSRAERVVHDLQTGALFNTQNQMVLIPSNDIKNHYCSSEVFLEHTKDLLSELSVHKLEIPDDEDVSLLDSALQNNHENFNCNSGGMRINNFSPHNSNETEDLANNIFNTLFEEQELENILQSSFCTEEKNDLAFCVEQAILKAVVGYLGTVEMPKETQVTVSRFQTIRNCIRRLQIEKKVHTHVLMTLYPQSIVLTNIQGSILAEFQANKITFFGVYSDNKNFFGLVTRHELDLNRTNENKSVNIELVNSSCHIFMVDSRLTPHHQHISKAKAFRFICTCDSQSNICREFPNSAEVILKEVAGLYGSKCFSEIPCCVVSHEQSLNISSNSDSGIGFRDEGISGSKVLIEGRCHQVTSVPSILDQTIVSYTECSISDDSPYSLGCTAVFDDSSESTGNLLHKNCGLNSNRLTVRVMPDPVGFNRTFQDTDDSSNRTNLSSSKHINADKDEYDILKSKNDVCKETMHLDNFDGTHLVNFQFQNIHSKLSPKVYDYANEHDILKMSIERTSVDTLECQCHTCIDIGNMTDKCLKSKNEMDTHELHSIKESLFFRTVKSTEILETKKKLLKSSSFRRHVSRKRNSSSGPYDVGTVSDGELTNPRFSTCTFFSSDHVSSTSLHGSYTSDGPKIGCVASWAAGFHILLEDPVGLRVFNEFLKDEFSQENIVFWSACKNYRHITDAQEMAKTASEIYLRHLRIGACEPVNVDSHARRVAEEGLEFPTENIFLPAQTQIFNLMKFDCYQRFLKSPVFKECMMCEIKGLPLPLENSISENQKEQDTEQKLISEERKKKFLFPWSK